MKKLQHQLSNGMWVYVPEDRIEEFLDRCVKHSEGIENHEQALEAMERGKELRNASEDWYSVCRLFDQGEHERKMQAIYKAEQERNRDRLYCKRCGQSGFEGNYPFSTAPGTGYCDDRL